MASINRENSKTNILWLSDIHLRGEYEKNPRASAKLERAYNSFLKRIEDETDMITTQVAELSRFIR